MRERNKKLQSNNKWRDKKSFFQLLGPDELFNINGFHWSLLFSAIKKHFCLKTFELYGKFHDTFNMTQNYYRCDSFKFQADSRILCTKNRSIQKKLNYFIDFNENGQIMIGDRELSNRKIRLMPKILVRILLVIFRTHINDTKIAILLEYCES